MAAKHRVVLSSGERGHLERIVRTGEHHARTALHARILLLSDEADEAPAWNDERIADALESSVSTVERVRKLFLREGIDAALRVKKPGRGRPKKIDAAAEAHLVALACSPAPEGLARWSLRLLTDRFVELKVTEEPVSHELVRQALKKRGSSLTARSSG